MQLSYWEKNTWFSNIHFTIVGSGIVGLSCALALRKKFPNKKILVLEKGILPEGASTKNAGFACFGSISEILDDLNNHTEKEVVELVKKRHQGLQLLKENIGIRNLEFKNYGGYELFLKEDTPFFEECKTKIKYINELLHPIFKEKVFNLVDDVFGFNNSQNKLIYNKFEGQINTGSMMQTLLKKCHKNNISILNGVFVESFLDHKNKVEIQINKHTFYSEKLIITTNGFAKQLGIKNVKPARAQVLITKPIKNLKIKGTFHLDKGYYYFRNINNRILFGGGRNLDFKAEETTIINTTPLMQEQLKLLLKNVILPKVNYEVDSTWSGIMGVGKEKKPIIKQLSENVYCGVRMGGMGIAIGSTIGKDIACLIE